MTFRATIPLDGVYAWRSQAHQYPNKGPLGIGYFAGETEFGVVHCLLYRDPKGDLVGILNYYDENMAPNPHEQPGNFNVWVRPDRQRRGIATALLTEAKRRWPSLTLDQQRFTESGAGLAQNLRDNGIM